MARFAYVSTFLREIETLKKKILAVGAVVEERISQAITAVVKRDAALAQQVAEGDDEIDEMEVEVEEDCLKILALYQPVAIDLRFVVAVLKMNNDLERMADTAVNIARRAEYLASQPQVDLPPNFTDMTQKVQTMVKQSLDALVQSDTALARMCVADREVDQLNKAMRADTGGDAEASRPGRASHAHLVDIPPSGTHWRSGDERS